MRDSELLETLTLEMPEVSTGVGNERVYGVLTREKQEKTRDALVLIDRLNIVQDTTTSKEGRIDLLEKTGLEATKNLVLEIDDKLNGHDESASQKLKDYEDDKDEDFDGDETIGNNFLSKSSMQFITRRNAAISIEYEINQLVIMAGCNHFWIAHI